MANLNKVFVIGNLTRDPQLSYLPSQTAVVEFGLAINRKWKNSAGESKEEVCYLECIAYGNVASTLNKYLKKGNPIFIEGRLRFESWKKDGYKHNRLKLLVEHFQFLSYNKNNEALATAEPGNDDIPF